jgi:hypothetical protein
VEGACGNEFRRDIMLQAQMSQVRFPMLLNILVNQILSAPLGTGVYSASNRNEHQRQIDNVSGELNV